jgi:lincosamide nucleotidyltransferase A/C/D/E
MQMLVPDPTSPNGEASGQGMEATEVVAIVEWIQGRGITYQVNGGWTVDALLGQQTRVHGDLDLFVDARHVPTVHDWLLRRGYAISEDWTPVRVELRSGECRVDVHPMRIVDGGDGVQQGLDGESFLHRAADRVEGVIGGRPVVVACAERLRALRVGYEPRSVDVHDLAILDELLSAGADD